MSYYTPGQIEITGVPVCDDADSIEVPVAALPHSCDEWIIGNADDCDALIADLVKIRDKLRGETQ